MVVLYAEGVCVKQSPDANENRKSFIENSIARLHRCVRTALCNRAMLFSVMDFRLDITCKRVLIINLKKLYLFFSPLRYQCIFLSEGGREPRTKGEKR